MKSYTIILTELEEQKQELKGMLKEQNKSYAKIYLLAFKTFNYMACGKPMSG